MKEEYDRVTLYVPKQDYRKLKSKLVLKGESVSEWLRQKIREELRK